MNRYRALCWVYNNPRFTYIANAEFRHLTSLYDPAWGTTNANQ
jgi:hypothetical protein